MSSTLKKLLYASGALGHWHRRRNRHRLTVIMFHRVLSTSDPRWAHCDPEYTLSEDLFVKAIHFLQRHYNVVSLPDLLAARAGDRGLPERPVLLTFDDGWSDNEEFALPHLRKLGLPSVMFVAGSAVGRREPFWQERLIHAWRSGRLDPERARVLWQSVALDTPPQLGHHNDLDGIRSIVARLEQLERVPRAGLLNDISDLLDDGFRHMVTTEQLRRLEAGGMAIGSHGFTHEPLTRVNAAEEIAQVRDLLAGLVKAAPVLSFPHGRFNEQVIEQVRAAGFPFLFTSVPELPMSIARGPGLFGRVGITSDAITGKGRFAAERMALYLFRKPHAGS